VLVHNETPPGPLQTGASAVIPLFQPLADLCSWRGGRVRFVHESDPTRVTALAVECDRRLGLLVANLTARRQEAILHGLAARSVCVRVLDCDSVSYAVQCPEEFRAQSAVDKVDGGTYRLGLAAHAVASLELEQ
jgi:hypothetical protein